MRYYWCRLYVVALHLSRQEYWCYLARMRIAPESRSIAPDLPLKYVGGDPSLDLVNTVDWSAHGLESDRLSDYERLTHWAEGAGIVSPAAAERLRRAALTRPHDAAAAYSAARWLRWVLQRLFARVAAGESPGTALDDFNELSADVTPRLMLAPIVENGRVGGGAMTWKWRDADEHLGSVLWPVVRSAAELLVSDEARRVRVCGGPNCGWMYVDRSRNGLRRWCQMGECGTREKSRRRARRNRSHE
jgi:predicted RNA-binding Zn ribbon-like protein